MGQKLLTAKQEDTSKLQQIIHYHGRVEFLEMLQLAFFNASDEMADLNLKESEEYRTLANSIEVEYE